MSNLKSLARYDFLDLCLLGETGTGKTHAAKIIHNASPRAGKPFVEVNCATLGETLVEAELFGYEKGAFTGALTAKPGKFEAANGGTLFLDEIGELSYEVQAKLLKAVEEKQITRLGSNVPRSVNVRIICATHRETNALREDLRYRIAAHTIRLPPLRERPDEIVPLAQTFISEFNQKIGNRLFVREATLKLLENSHWRGNLRQLRSTLFEACLAALFVADEQNAESESSTMPQVEITAKILLSAMPSETLPEQPTSTLPPYRNAAAPIQVLRLELVEHDRQIIKQTLLKNNQNVTRTATELGLSRNGLIKKMKRLKIDEDE